MFIELKDTKNLLNLMYVCDCTNEDNVVIYTLTNGSIVREVLSTSQEAENRVSDVKSTQTGGGGSQPTGTINITENGLQNVSQYAKANVNVPQLDTSDATAAEINIRDSKTAYVNGQKITGSLPVITYPVNPVNPKDWNYQFIAGDSALNTVRDGVNYLVGSYQIATENQPDSWMFEGNRKMKLGIPFSIVSSTLGVTANKIKKGETIAGVTGTYEGVQPNLQSKSVTITENGTTTVAPDTGYDGLNSVSITTDVQSGGSKPILPKGTYFKGSTFTEFDLFKDLDLSNIEGMASMFEDCRKLVSFGYFDSSNIQGMVSTFKGCSALTTLPGTTNPSQILDTSNLMYFQDCFSGCMYLSNDSLNVILRMCINATKITGNKTLKYIGLADWQATTCQTLSNWDDFVAAGWTTGY